MEVLSGPARISAQLPAVRLSPRSGRVAERKSSAAGASPRWVWVPRPPPPRPPALDGWRASAELAAGLAVALRALSGAAPRRVVWVEAMRGVGKTTFLRLLAEILLGQRLDDRSAVASTLSSLCATRPELEVFVRALDRRPLRVVEGRCDD